jgi:type IV secretion system protein VirB11
MILKIPSNEHVIILEDTHELITTRPNHTTLIAKDSNSNNSLKDFVSYSMRMRPDRIIVGEMRSHEIVPLLLAINSGHRGVMSTIHSNSARDSLSKTALLFTLFSKQAELSFNLVLKIVCTNIDYVIHLEKRKIKEIIKVFGSEDSTPSFERIYEATKL